MGQHGWTARAGDVGGLLWDADLALRQPLITWTTNVSISGPALPVTFQQPRVANVIVLAQKCGARVSPGATLARSRCA
jgi:hypothetical protein